MEFYEEDKIKIQNILVNLSGKISFTTDCWTSPSSKSFMFITAHFIDNNWKLQHILLDFIIEMYDLHIRTKFKKYFCIGIGKFFN